MPNGLIHTTIASQKTATTFADDRRKKIAEEQAEVNAEKARNLILQRSLDSSPERRIALWEARHGLTLPSAANHPLMRFIAESTNLEPAAGRGRTAAQARANTGAATCPRCAHPGNEPGSAADLGR
jgi:hypothetical protein